jgi:hypothetical protein
MAKAREEAELKKVLRRVCHIEKHEEKTRGKK